MVPDMSVVDSSTGTGSGPAGGVIDDWRPEDPQFWSSTGRAVATRNLWLSIPALLLAFAVWMMFSAVAVKLKDIGFRF